MDRPGLYDHPGASERVVKQKAMPSPYERIRGILLDTAGYCPWIL